MDAYVSKKSGKRINPAAETHEAVVGSGQKLTCTAANTNYTVIVVSGGKYSITADATGVIFLGIAAITTDANIIWAVGPGGTLGIEIPEGYTTLHYGSDTAGTIGRLAQLA